MTETKSHAISDEEIRDIAVQAGFTMRDQEDGRCDLNSYVYDFARKLIRRAKNIHVKSETTAKSILIVKVDKRTGATKEYEVSSSVIDAAQHWLSSLQLSSDMSLISELGDTPYMFAKVLTNNLDDRHVYMLVRGNELNEMGAAINALIHKRWPSMEDEVPSPFDVN